MINKLNSKLLFLIFIFFVVFHLAFSVSIGNSFFSNLGLLQLFFLSAFIVFFSIAQRVSNKQIFFLIGVYQFALVLGLFLYYIVIYDDPLGFAAVDAVYYDDLGHKLQEFNFVRSIDYLLKIGSTGDVGFPILLKSVYSLGGNEIMNMKIFNILFHLITCLLLLKISRLLFEDKVMEKYLLILYGFNPISIYFNASGLKEPFLVLIVTLSFYFLYKAVLKRRTLYYFLGFMAILVTGLFRVIFPIFIFTSFAFYLFLTVRGKYKFFTRTLLFICSLVLFGIIYAVVKEELTQKMSYDVAAISAGKLGRSPGILDYIFITISNFVGPFPSFVFEKNQDHLLLQTVGNFIKLFFSFFFLIGVYHSVRSKILRLYPILLVIIFNVAMLIPLTMIGHRFLYPFMSLYFIVLAFGFSHVKSQNIKMVPFSTYLVFFILIIFTYNFR